MKPAIVMALYHLMKLGAHTKSVHLNTRDLGKHLDLSQQSASRRLLELEKLGLVDRRVGRRGQQVRLTGDAIEALREVYVDLKPVFEKVTEKEVVLEGSVFTGLKEGAYYLSIEGYRKQLREKLGFDPYPGTFNLRLRSRADIEARRLLESTPPIMIDVFSDDRRSFGGAKVYKATIGNGIEGAVIVIDRSHYGPDVVEVISPFYLREKLGVKDGDVARVRVPVQA